MKKLFLTLFAVMLASPAFAICTSVSVPATATSTQVLAALDIAPRHQIWLNGTSSCPAWCDIGATAVAFSGYLVMPGNPAVYLPPSQQNAATFPITASGAVNCIIPQNMGCQAQNVTACDW